ncbi:hypothetical protein [Halocatena salina]|uniref:Uncharacterized protein n=1 Tax=Halocatena salina TaxID=2934340 RepID=A0A8U0A9H4_9EURY|nr:hypothetical protein [Halocatena salina]UPM44643.1 hypothetical protein MW046_16515 [Halocatena salina]
MSTSSAGVHPVSHSTMSPLSAMYVALFPEKVVALGLSPPLHFAVESGLFDVREIAERHDPQRRRLWHCSSGATRSRILLAQADLET